MLRKLIIRNFGKSEKIFDSAITSFVEHHTPIKLQNFINGNWEQASKYELVPNPLNGAEMFHSPCESSPGAIDKVLASMARCTKSGLHNPLKNPQLYRMWGEVFQKAANLLGEPEIEQYFCKLIAAVMPKHSDQILGEVRMVRKYLENFTGDNPRFALRGFIVPGDSDGQETVGYRFPYGPVAVIAPFNFPFMLPALHVTGALFSGNKALLKPDHRTGIVAEAFVRLLLHCGMPHDSLVLWHNNGANTEALIQAGSELFRLVQFTGSSKVADKLSDIMNGKVKIEDSGYNWKILGPDVHNVEYVAYQCDQDAYAASGQKCSAQRLLVMHENWVNSEFLSLLKSKAQNRSISNLTVGPCLSWTNEKLSQHVHDLLSLPGAKLMWGGRPITEAHHIPAIYGSFQPTAIFLPLSTINNPLHYDLVFTEVFAPFQIITQYNDSELNTVLQTFDKIHLHLAAGVVSNDLNFIQHVVKNSVNGVTYVGTKGRTTGAPQNHFFGPGNDPRASGMCSTEAIASTWTYHREVVYDFGSLNGKLNAIKQS